MTVRLAAIPGDGVGPEVVAATLPVLSAALASQGEDLAVTELDWGADRFVREGAAMPPDAADTVRRHDAVLFGAVGRPDVPDHELVWGLIIGLRQQLDLAVNIRPVRAFEGVPSRVKDVDGVDLVIVRENTEGEYVGAGGLAHAGTGHDLGIEVAVHSRRVIERAAEHAFTLAEQRRGRLSLVTKSNAMRHGYPLWDAVVREVAERAPGRRARGRARRRHGGPARAESALARRPPRRQPLRRHPQRPRCRARRRHGDGPERQRPARRGRYRVCTSRSTARRPTSQVVASPTPRRACSRVRCSWTTSAAPQPRRPSAPPWLRPFASRTTTPLTSAARRAPRSWPQRSCTRWSHDEAHPHLHRRVGDAAPCPHRGLLGRLGDLAAPVARAAPGEPADPGATPPSPSVWSPSRPASTSRPRTAPPSRRRCSTTSTRRSSRSTSRATSSLRSPSRGRSRRTARTYTFDLVDNAKFTDGQPFTAKDAVYSIDQVKNAWTVSLKAAMDVVQDAKALSDTKLQVTLSKPSNDWLYRMSTRVGAMMTEKETCQPGHQAGRHGPLRLRPVAPRRLHQPQGQPVLLGARSRTSSR